MKRKDYPPRPGKNNCHLGSSPEHPFTMDTEDLFHHALYLHVPQWVPHFGLEWHQERLRERVPNHIVDCSNCDRRYGQYAALLRQYTPEQLLDMGKRHFGFPSLKTMHSYIDRLVEQDQAAGFYRNAGQHAREHNHLNFVNGGLWEYINPYQRYRWPVPPQRLIAPTPGVSTDEQHPPTV